MRIRWFKKLSREARHPSVEDLLPYLDGEAETKHAEEIREHLESCWTCRARREKIERSINDLVEFAAVAAPRPTEPRPQARDRFLFALKSLAEDRGQSPPFGQRLGRKIEKLLDGVRERASFLPAFDSALDSIWTIRLSVGLLTLCLLAAAFVFLDRQQTVSAHELIDRVTRAEAQAIRVGPQPVIYQRINARRIGPGIVEDAKAVTLEVWREIGSQRMRHRVAGEGDAMFTRLEQILRANDRQSPLSVAEFSAWRRATRIRTESVSETTLPDGSEALRLRTVIASPHSANQIVESELVVRARDWHPVSERMTALTSAGTEEYEFTEEAYLVVALGDLNPAIFSDPATPVKPLTASANSVSPSLVPPSPAATAAPRPPGAELTAAEFDARFRLHQMQADLEGNLEIKRTATGVLVSGIVDTASRKQELINALSSIAHVSLNIQTTEEAARALTSRHSGVSAPPADSPVTLETGVASPATESRRSFRQKLARHFERRLATTDAAWTSAAVAQLSNDAVSLCSAAMAESWAMRRLAEHYATAGQASLAPTDRERLDQILKTHAQRIGARVGRLQLLLAPVLAELSGNHLPPDSGERMATADHWVAQTQAIFQNVKQLDRLVGELFIDSKGSSSGEATARALLETFPRLIARLGKFEQTLNQ
jgi:hypothetical protein